MIFKICFLFICFSSNVHLTKITLYDSTKQREDLNWSKFSFKESSTDVQSNFDWIQQKLNSKSDLDGWKESSYSSSGGDNVWRIHFVCDLNVQNIQNWLFTPLINTNTANRITLNLTFTIRECENLPVKQVKNCREKFELYFEEKNTDEDNYLTVQSEFKDLTEQNRSNLFLLNKIKQLRFRDTFISDTGLRYYNSIVDRQKYKTISNRPGESSINVELREISLSGQNPNFVRFAIRDTGACISLLSVQITYVTCSTLKKYGIYFPETPTGKDLTDLVQVEGQCPDNSGFTQKPKAICTAKGEWLITDSNLATKCQCNPGFEFINDKCIQCPIGYFKSAISNEQKCEPCPSNSWSSAPGMASCDCLKGFYKLDPTHDLNMCQQIPNLILKDVNFNFVSDDKINITLDRKDKNLPSSVLATDIKCFQCDSFNINGYAINKCELNCFILNSFENSIMILNRKLNRISRIKLIIKLKLKNTDISEKVFFLNLKQNKHERMDKKFDCQSHNDNNKFCFNISMDLENEIDKTFPKSDLIEKINDNKLIRSSIFALVINNDFQLIPSDFNPNYNFQQSNSKSSYIQVPTNFLESYSKKNWSTEFTFCHSKQIEKFRLQFDVDTSNYKNFQQNDIEIYTIDFQLNQMCSERPKMVTEIITNHAYVRLTESLIIKDEPVSSKRSNVKMQVILPTILSSVIIFFVALLILFLNKIKNSKKDDGQFNKFINKKCANKCNSCSNTNTSCSSSTSSSPSTICTTSQIIERESKLYYVDPHTYEDPTLAVQEFAQEISPLDIKIESVIGGGEFGDVCKGKLKLDQNWITVAIKTLKVGSSEKNRCEFLTEASIMAQFNHENIICLEGVVTQSHPFMIITEYMDNGSLDTFLRLNSWRLNIYDLVKMLKDIANGMKYLSAMNFVHRDLAARNILVDKDLKCKVADFGLSREIEGTNTEGVYWTKGGKIPVRWTAPEAITHTKFTCSSDVWSFGVVMWEVMSYGERPYWNWSNTDVIKAVDKGFRLLIPASCPQILYNMMLDCWETDRLKRPKFKKIANDLDLLIKSRKETLFVPAKNLKTNSNIDTNRPNFTHLTSVQEWLNSLNLIDYVDLFVNRRLLNLSHILNFELEDLIKMEIFDSNHQMIILDSIKRILFELNFQNGFLV